MIKKLISVSCWCNAIKLLLNVEKTSIFFPTNHKNSIDNIPLWLPNINKNGLTVKHEPSVKFLGVRIDENLTWADHIHIVKNKMAKTWWKLPQANLLCLHTYYINYANLAWARTFQTKLKKAQSKEKHTLCKMFNQSKTSPSETLFLNVNFNLRNLCIK